MIFEQNLQSCCLTWMAWTPGVHCSHGIFLWFFSDCTSITSRVFMRSVDSNLAEVWQLMVNVAKLLSKCWRKNAILISFEMLRVRRPAASRRYPKGRPLPASATPKVDEDDFSEDEPDVLSFATARRHDCKFETAQSRTRGGVWRLEFSCRIEIDKI